jgi:hypothetical protein
VSDRVPDPFHFADLWCGRIPKGTIMETLGHSQISLTLNTYSHVLPALQAAAAEKLDAVPNG